MDTQQLQQRLAEAQEQYAQGKHSDAVTLYRDLLQTLQGGARVLALDGLGRCLNAQDDMEAAEACFVESATLLEQLFGADHPHTATGKLNMARQRSLRGYPAEAAQLAEQAVAILKQALGDQHPRVADALLSLSSNQYMAGDYAHAESNLLSALQIWEALNGRRSFEVSTCLNNLGRICEERGESRQGVHYHEEALSIRKELLGDHPETAFSLGNLGAALAGDRQWARAVATLEEAVQCHARIGSADTPDAALCKQNLDRCREQWQHEQEGV